MIEIQATLIEQDKYTEINWYEVSIDMADYVDNGPKELYGLNSAGQLLDSEGFPCEGNQEYDSIRYELEQAQL